MTDTKVKPKIENVTTVAKSRLFHIEAVDLTFSNGEHRVFERLKPGSRKAVIIAAMPDSETILLINEYAVGTESYELGLPKGLVDHGEGILEAANRELQEEVGMQASNIEHIISLSLAPNYMSHSTDLILATDLSPKKLEGDEPEPLGVFPVKLADLDNLIKSGELREVRSIASLYIIKNHLAGL